jgi:hypothetical protein
MRMQLLEGMLVAGAVVGGVVVARELRRHGHPVGDTVARWGTTAAEQAGKLTTEVGRLTHSAFETTGNLMERAAGATAHAMESAGRTAATGAGTVLGRRAVEEAPPPPARKPAPRKRAA